MKLEKGTNLHKARKSLIKKASNRVLEIGSGTGINFPLYDQVTLDAIEPNNNLMKRSLQRKGQATVPIQVHKQTAETLSFPENTFDSVVSTLVFCTIPEPMKALKKIQYVAKPKATILFLEHVKVEQPFIAKSQDILTPLWKRIAGNCHLNRNTLENIRNSGLVIEDMTTYYQGLLIAVTCKNIK